MNNHKTKFLTNLEYLVILITCVLFIFSCKPQKVIPIEITDLDLINTEIGKVLSEKYCDSLEKRLFVGLDKEYLLKYVYFFSDISNKKEFNQKNTLDNFKLNVKNKCGYKIDNSTEKEFVKYLQKYFSEIN